MDPIDIKVKAVKDRPESGQKGVIAADLREQDFTVFGDEVRQSIRLYRHADLAITAGLAGDPSRDMRAKLADVVTASRTFARFSSSEDEMFAVTFNGNVALGLLPPPHFTNRQDEWTAAGGRR